MFTQVQYVKELNDTRFKCLEVRKAVIPDLQPYILPHSPLLDHDK